MLTGSLAVLIVWHYCHVECSLLPPGAPFELVLRQIEHGMDSNATTDLQLLLSSRDNEGGLPPPDLSAPHPFRGSGPGQRFACICTHTGILIVALTFTNCSMHPQLPTTFRFSPLATTLGKAILIKEPCYRMIPVVALKSASPLSFMRALVCLLVLLIKKWQSEVKTPLMFPCI